MATRGRVREWHDDEGWGLVDAEEAPGGCWAHFSAVRVDGFKSLASGTEVLLELEPADQDGYDFCALAGWRADEQPVDGGDQHRRAVTGVPHGAEAHVRRARAP